MVLKPQIQDLVKKQYFSRFGQLNKRPSHLLLTILHVRSNQVFLTDGILIVATKKQEFLHQKMKCDRNQNVNLKDMEGFVCLFKNSKFEIFEGNKFERLNEKFLNLPNKNKTKMINETINFEKQNGVSNLGVHPVEDADSNENQNLQIDQENDLNRSNNKLFKKICKKGPKRDKVNKSKSNKSYSINLFFDFDKFNIVCPYGGYYLQGSLQMMMDSFSETQLLQLEQNYKLNKHISNFTKTTNNDTPIIDISNILNGFTSRRKLSEVEEDGTTTSTPANENMTKPVKRKCKRSKANQKLKHWNSQII